MILIKHVYTIVHQDKLPEQND